MIEDEANLVDDLVTKADRPYTSLALVERRSAREVLSENL